MLEEIQSHDITGAKHEEGPTTAVLFPGQGSQQPGMGRAFYDAWPTTREWFETLSDAVDVDVTDLCFDGDAATLSTTEYTQPCVYTVSVATFAGLASRYGVVPDYVAGHSLGHVGALTSAGCLDPAEGVELVRKRGQHMQRAAERGGDGVMLAVICRDPAVVERACDRIEGVSLAARNTDSQTVVSGPAASVEQVRDRIADNARARFAELDVGAAFHSAAMEPAATAFDEDLAAMTFQTTAVPVVSDVSGEVYGGGERAVDELGTQVVETVDWRAVVETLRDRGVERFVEVPPAGTLSRFVDTLCPDLETIPLESPADAAEVFTA
ncbi:ACP S-malonyltransferase [Haloarcula sp. JP-L23]|uniref:ACP S-malonyltransferase n=1 Tax=Haloarcula sp. JP-L23 TaxID=2716717 RepID=UPI00140F1E6B|nr:ACP S-malonyltransferase [Haloarcula sp. JP-L23]